MSSAPSFPRGKKKHQTAAAPSLTAPPTVRPARKRKHSDADAAATTPAPTEPPSTDVLFGKKSAAALGASSDAASKKVKKTSAAKAASSRALEQQNASKDDELPRAAVITFKTLRKGMLLLGCVRQVNDQDVLISLPNKLNGVVSLNECSDEHYTQAQRDEPMDGSSEALQMLPPLPQLLQVGQFVPCVVLGTSKDDKGKKISLSLRMSRVYSEWTPQHVDKGMALHGTVSSMEDHGAIVNVGIRGLNAFIPRAELQKAELMDVPRGTHLFLSVLAKNEHTNTITVTPDRAQTIKCVTRGDSFTLQRLVPGMLLNVRVEDVLSNGLRVNFLTFFSATVEQNHMSTPCQRGWEEQYRKGLKARARIVSIDRVKKEVTLSMAPHVVHCQVPETTYVVGDIIEDAQIQRIDAGIGMLLSLRSAPSSSKETDSDGDEPMEEEPKKKWNWKDIVPAYVHISNVADERVDKLEKKFQIGQSLRCRVIGFAPFDAMVNVSCKASSLSQTVLRHVDLEPGTKVQGKILAIEPWGILLEISEGVRGLVTAQHVPSQALIKQAKKKQKDPSGRYRVGKTVEARVLRVDIEAKKTYLTMKKALVSSELPVLKSYDEATNGRVAQGFITKIANYGVVVSFYNGVFGLVPAAALHQAGIEVLEDAYVVGQVVKACVTRCDKAKQRMMLSFNTTSMPAASNGSKTEPSGAAMGVKPEVVGSTVDTLKVLEIESTHARVQTSDGLEGVLPFVQLSDFPRENALVDAHVEQLKASPSLSGPFLVVSQERDGLLTFSKKPLLLECAKKTISGKASSLQLPSTFDDVKENAVFLGFVASVNAQKGVFVKFLNNLTALAPKAFLSDAFLSQVDEGLFEVGETVICHVEKVDPEKRQFVVGFRKIPVLERSRKRVAPFFQAYVSELSSVMTFPRWSLGKTEKADFVGLRPYGAVFTLGDENEEMGTVIVPNVKQSSWEAGDRVKLVLVDFDVQKRVYYGSVEDALVKSCSKKARKQKQRMAPSARVSKATVLALGASEKYAIVSFADSKDSSLLHVGIVQVADFWAPGATCGPDEAFSVGSTLANCHVVLPSLAGGHKRPSPFDEFALLTKDVESVLDSAASKRKKKANSDHADGEEHSALPKYHHEDLALGRLVTGRIVGIKEDALEIKLKVSKKCGKVVASVSIVDVDPDASGAHDHPFDQFSVNMKVEGRVIALLQKGANQRKPVSATNPANYHVLHLSLRKTDVEGNAIKADVATLARADWQPQSVGRALLQVGKRIEGVVVEQSADGLLVRLSHRVVGFLHCLELSQSLDELRSFRQRFPVGKRVSCYVMDVDEDKSHVHLSLVHKSKAEMAKLAVGSVVPGLITTKMKALKPPSIMVQLSAHAFGRVCATELLPPAQWQSNVHELPQFANGEFVQCVVLSHDAQAIELSLRPDAVADPKDYVKATAPKRDVGSLVTGFVVSTAASGCFIRIDRSTTARVMLRDLSDDFVKDPKAAFPMGKLVAGRVVKQTAKGLELSLKASIVSENVAMLKWSDLRVGMTVKGTITKVQPYGVFVRIEKSNISGLCHISEIADTPVEQSLDQVFTEGDYVKAKILKIEDLRVSFGLKPSYFEGEESSSEESEDSDSEDDEEADEQEEDTRMVVDMEHKKVRSEIPEPMEVDDLTSEDESASPATKSQGVEFTWDGFSNVLEQFKKPSATAPQSDSDDDSDDDEAQEGQLSKHQKKKQKQQSEEWIALREKALANDEQVPQSAEDYERLLAVSPHSSYLWIQYMAFHVSLAEIDLARDVAQRATSAVSFRDEKEKLNVWVAYMNLEHDFGDDESFMRVFKSALQVNHPKRIHLQLVDIYVRANEHDDARQTLETMQKKFKKSKQTWIRALQYLVRHEQSDEAAATLQRALQSLAGHKHLPVILKYGQLMYEHNEMEKARTIFEGILANYPKRMDLWNVYLDKEIKFGGDRAFIRQLFERLLAMDFSAKKMKFLFKKYLQYEQQHGDAAGVDHVKELAKQFVAQAAPA